MKSHLNELIEWEDLEETLFWLSQEGVSEAVNEARREAGDGGGLSEQQIRDRFGTPRTD